MAEPVIIFRVSADTLVNDRANSNQFLLFNESFMAKHPHQLQVNSEIGTLKRLLVHSPDSGLGKVVPSKAQDWLFEDIVHLDTIRKKEYDFYTKILLYFLDPEKIKGKLKDIDEPAKQT